MTDFLDQVKESFRDFAVSSYLGLSSNSISLLFAEGHVVFVTINKKSS